VYWIRAIQHFGGERLQPHQDIRARYDLLYPLLDLTTTLDPFFKIAYRFGAIFLSEAPPGGPGRPDLAVALLRKAIAAQPGKWQYYHDIAFVYYWNLRDYRAAAEWFRRAADQPEAPNWLAPVAASMLTQGNDRASARFLWRQLLNADQPWLRTTAKRSLLQIDAMDVMDQLDTRVRQYPPPAGERYSWVWLVRRGALRGIPGDPTGTPYEIDPDTGRVTISQQSALFPMPDSTRNPKP
jgi:tetratricopeptide (TPR) repeat protein